MQKYQVLTPPGRPNYRQMQATAAIEPGEEILSEETIINFTIGLSDTHDPDRFFNARDNFTGSKQLEALRRQLPDQKRNLLDALYHKRTTRPSTTSRVQTNAFGDDDKRDDGVTYMVLRVYNEISRVNHSCRPNAAVVYNGRVERGSLRALVHIAAGDEILVDYVSGEKHTLCARPERLKQLKKHWDFECNCAACSLDGQASNIDDNRRRTARDLLKEVKARYGPYSTWRGENQEKMRKLGKVKQYIAALERLEITDGKLAWAYNKLCDQEQEVWEVADDVRQHGLQHCAGL